MKKLKADGQKAVAITDHGNMHGVVDFYKAARAHDIKPILGVEAYFTAGHRIDAAFRNKESKIYHLVLLAMNNEGYQNLLKIVSLAYEEGFYRYARVDRELLEMYGDGIIAMSACIKGAVPNLLLEGKDKEAYEMAEFFKFNFDKRFFLEIQANGLDLQEEVNPKLIKMAKEMNIPLVGTCDCHYLDKQDSEIHDLIKLIQTKSTINNRKMSPLDPEFFVKTRSEAEIAFKDHPEAIKSTQIITEMCNVELELGEFHFPVYDITRDPDYKEFQKWQKN